MSQSLMRVRQAADAAGVRVDTLRYYERRGLLAPPRRSRAGYREYAPEAIALVRFVKRAQALGFTLEEIEALLALRRPRRGRCAAVHATATKKLAEIDAKLRDLAAIRAALLELTAACVADADPLRCPLLEAITAEPAR